MKAWTVRIPLHGGSFSVKGNCAFSWFNLDASFRDILIINVIEQVPMSNLDKKVFHYLDFL